MKKEFKGTTVEEAIEAGLLELGIKKEDANINIISDGGFLKKACVEISYDENESVNPDDEMVTEPEDFIDDISSEPIELNDDIDLQTLAIAEKEAVDFVIELIDKMNVRCHASSTVKDNSVYINITGEDAGAVIGRHGESLDAVQYMVSLIINKNRDPKIRIIVDAENYRERRAKTMEMIANKYARHAHKKQIRVALEPMGSFERRVIHMTLKEDNFVITRSEGAGRDRHVVIIPVDEEGYEIPSELENINTSFSNGDRRNNSVKDEIYSSPLYGTSSEFRKRGAGKTRSFGKPKRRF